MKKSIERKIKSIEERLERLRALSESLSSYENYQISTDTKDIAERNIQVHGYDKVDDSLIFGILKRHLGDFYTFLKQIKDKYLTQK